MVGLGNIDDVYKHYLVVIEENQQFKELLKECRDFFFLLSACYFHPERKYSSEEVKELAKQAMISLWQRKSITVWSIEFEHEYIRDIIINKMMPEDLDRAIAEADAIKDKFGNKLVYEITGQPEITAGWPASKVLWLKNNKPDVFAKTKMEIPMDQRVALLAIVVDEPDSAEPLNKLLSQYRDYIVGRM